MSAQSDRRRTRHASRRRDGRRQRDPVLAQEPAQPAQAVAPALRRRRRCSSRPSSGSRPWSRAERTWIITGADQAEAVRAQLPELPADNVVAEPCPRDTAACVGLAATIVARHDPEGTMIVMPADHVIEPGALFRKTARAAAARDRRRPHGVRHLRHQADPPRDRLRLHRARRVAGRRRRDRAPPGRPVPREARPADRRDSSWPRAGSPGTRASSSGAPGPSSTPWPSTVPGSPRPSTGSAQALGTARRGRRRSPANTPRWSGCRSTRP